MFCFQIDILSHCFVYFALQDKASTIMASHLLSLHTRCHPLYCFTKRHCDYSSSSNMHLRPQLFTRCRYLCDGECAKLWLCNESLYDACLSAFALVLFKSPVCAIFSLLVTTHGKKNLKTN